MINHKLLLGTQLKIMLSTGFHIADIASWAYKLIRDFNNPYLPSLVKILEQISIMNLGSEFFLKEEELHEIADRWIEEGEYEELGKPLSEIKQLAEDIGKGWLYCPICHEAWESRSKYAMVECPQCKNKLHNPMYVPKTENSF